MAKTEAQVLAKLDTPPAAHNWALSNFQEKRRITSALVNLAIGFPQISYFWAHKAIQITLADQRTDAEAVEILRRSCPPSQWDHNLEPLYAFLDYNEKRRFNGLRVYDEFDGHFFAGPDVRVPVRPTAILREDGVLKPLFVIGWANNGLKYYQRRLLTTIYEDAIFSLTDFRQSPGEVLIFPRNGYGRRVAERWERGSYQQLSSSEMVEQVERFVTAREEARLIIPVRLKEQAARRAQKAAASKGAGIGSAPESKGRP